MDPCTRNLEGNQRETSIQISELESMTKQDPIEGRNHDETGSSRRESLEIMRELDPLKGRQRETHMEKSLENDGKRDETGSSRRETHMERSLEIMR